jgi:hypothetical protein
MAESHLLTTKHPDVNMTPDFSHIKTKAFGLNRLIMKSIPLTHVSIRDDVYKIHKGQG